MARLPAHLLAQRRRDENSAVFVEDDPFDVHMAFLTNYGMKGMKWHVGGELPTLPTYSHSMVPGGLEVTS
jgi:hypothetical protein